MQVCGPLSSEKKELLRRDYARAMSDKLCDKHVQCYSFLR
jgi:hypothetical protein